MMASEAAAAIPPAAKKGGRTASGSEALAQGLMLVRASAINVVRLQLAMERRDRRVALATVDELMLLDRRISDLVGDLSAPSDPLSAEIDALEHQHRALAVERLVLAAGTSGPRIATSTSRWIEPAAEPADGLPELLESEPVRFDEPREITIHLVVALLMLVAIMAGAAVFLLFTITGQAMIAGLNLQGAS